MYVCTRFIVFSLNNIHSTAARCVVTLLYPLNSSHFYLPAVPFPLCSQSTIYIRFIIVVYLFIYIYCLPFICARFLQKSESLAFALFGLSISLKVFKTVSHCRTLLLGITILGCGRKNPATYNLARIVFIPHIRLFCRMRHTLHGSSNVY